METTNDSAADSRRYDNKAQIVGLEGFISRLKEYIEDRDYYTNRWANHKLITDVVRQVQASDRPVAVCEWGCYLGKPSQYLAGTLENARVHGFDVSPLSIEKANRVSHVLGVETKFDCMDALKLDYPSESFDIAYGFGVLHHIHQPETYREIYRVLKKGGQALFVEPTQFNPLIRLYRKVRSEDYSPDERPFELEMFDEIREWIPEGRVTWSGEQLLTTYVMLLELALRKMNKEVAQKRGVEKVFAKLQRSLGKVDDVLLGSVPYLQRVAQLVTVRIYKP